MGELSNGIKTESSQTAEKTSTSNIHYYYMLSISKKWFRGSSALYMKVVNDMDYIQWIYFQHGIKLETYFSMWSVSLACLDRWPFKTCKDWKWCRTLAERRSISGPDPKLPVDKENLYRLHCHLNDIQFLYITQFVHKQIQKWFVKNV